MQLKLVTVVLKSLARPREPVNFHEWMCPTDFISRCVLCWSVAKWSKSSRDRCRRHGLSIQGSINCKSCTCRRACILLRAEMNTDHLCLRVHHRVEHALIKQEVAHPLGDDHDYHVPAVGQRHLLASCAGCPDPDAHILRRRYPEPDSSPIIIEIAGVMLYMLSPRQTQVVHHRVK